MGAHKVRIRPEGFNALCAEKDENPDAVRCLSSLRGNLSSSWNGLSLLTLRPLPLYFPSKSHVRLKGRQQQGGWTMLASSGQLTRDRSRVRVFAYVQRTSQQSVACHDPLRTSLKVEQAQRC